MGKKRKLNLEQHQAFVGEVMERHPEGLQGMSFLGILQWGAQTVLKHAMIAEVNAYIGTQPYERIPEGMASKGERNGFRETTVDTPIGPICYERQRLVNAPGFESKLHQPYMRRPEEFAAAVTDMYVEGISTRKLKRALKAVGGKKVKLSKSTVSRITQKLREEFKEWKTRSLKDKKSGLSFFGCDPNWGAI